MVRPGNYLITGIAGSGKTTVVSRLVHRGFTAYSTDEMPEVSGLFDRMSGQFLDPGEKPAGEGPTDFSRYAWYWRQEGLEVLLARDPATFIGASVMNQYELLHLFDMAFVLTIDPDTLRDRIITRANSGDVNTYGKHPKELERILSLHAERERAALDHGAVPIVGTQPISKVVDDILTRVEL